VGDDAASAQDDVEGFLQNTFFSDIALREAVLSWREDPLNTAKKWGNISEYVKHTLTLPRPFLRSIGRW
jgi:hypothetical protein